MMNHWILTKIRAKKHMAYRSDTTHLLWDASTPADKIAAPIITLDRDYRWFVPPEGGCIYYCPECFSSDVYHNSSGDVCCNCLEHIKLSTCKYEDYAQILRDNGR